MSICPAASRTGFTSSDSSARKRCPGRRSRPSAERPLGPTAGTESDRAEEDPGARPSVGSADRRQRRCPRLETAGTTQPVKRTNLTMMLCLSGRVEPQRKLPLRAPRPPYRTLQGWALGTLIEQGYIISVSAKYSHFMDLFTFERFRSRRRRPPPLAQHLRAPGRDSPSLPWR